MSFMRLHVQFSIGVYSIFLLQDVMRSDPAKDHPSRIILKSETIVHGHRAFPAICCPDDPLDTEGGVMKIIEKKEKFFFEHFPDILGQGFVLLPETVAECILCYFFSHSMPSSAV